METSTCFFPATFKIMAIISISFIAGTGGQSTLSAVNPGNLGLNNLSVMNGSRVQSGILAIYAFNINNNNKTLTVSQYNLLNNTAVDTLGSLTKVAILWQMAPWIIQLLSGLIIITRQGQAANVGPGSTGLELAIPLSLLGNPGGPLGFWPTSTVTTKVICRINCFQDCLWNG
jgi:hypothetical protein